MLRLTSIWLERALRVYNLGVYVSLNVIPTHCILVQAFEFGGTPATDITAPALLIKDHLRAITHHFGRFTRDLRLEVKLRIFLFSLGSALIVDNFVTSLAIIDE